MEAATELKLLPRCGLSPLRSDPELQPLFDKATELRTASVPAHPWDNVLSLIDRVQVEDFTRQPEALKIYMEDFMPLLRKKYGSASNFIAYRLQLPLLTSTPEPYRAADQDFRIHLADWPYAFEPAVGHFIVWTRHQLLCKARVASAEEWERLQTSGFCGYTSNGGLNAEGKLAGYATGAEEHGSEVRKFVLANWPDDAYETAFFINPVKFQSIQDLAHFHVIVRRRRGAP